MRIYAFLIVFFLTGLYFTSCEDELGHSHELEEFFAFETDGDIVTDQGVLELVNQLELDPVPTLKKIMQYPDGTSKEVLVVGGDIAITEKELRSITVDNNEKQYRTFNLVTGSNRTINILGFTGSLQGLSSKAQLALNDAVNNYNRLSGVSLNFILTFGSSQSAIDNADMVVFDNSINESGSGGVAGFPNSSGQPNKFCAIFNLEGFSRNVNEHVITHEIGHSVGFRHTDWFNRISCGQNVNEGSAGVGAVHIPGTPTGNDGSSLMNACFSASSNGEFNRNDRRALRRIY